MRRLFILGTTLTFFLSAFTLWIPGSAHAAFNPNDIIDDSIFDNASSMSAGQIDSWLNSNFGSTSCISTAHGFSAPDPTGYSPSSGFTYGANVSGGQVIYDSAQAYGLNPAVLITTLQKEQSLVTGGAGCSTYAYSAAVGYGCPDGGTTYNYSGVNLYTINGSTVTAVNGTCVNTSAKVGFSQQLIRAAWLLKFGEQRSKGNTSWAVIKPGWDNSDDPGTCYSGPMTQGSFKRCSSDVNPVFYDGYIVIDSSSTHMDSGATAALYWYTPHFSGNQHFYSLYSQWFGNPVSPCASTTNVSGAMSGNRVISYQYDTTNVTRLLFLKMNNTGSSCAEAHIWNYGYQSWLTHIATGMRATDPAYGTIVAMKSGGSSRSGLVYLVYNGSGGFVEVHKFSPNLLTFPGYYDVPTNLGGVSATSGTFVAGDFLGRGYDQMAYVLYSGSGGNVEVHLFDPTLKKAVGYYDVPTNLGGVSATSGTFVAGDFLGRGYDQMAYVLYSGSGGKVEVHLFDPSLRKAVGFYDVATNLSGATATNGTFVAGDFLGRGYDQLSYAMYNGTGSGMVESHVFSKDLRQGTGFQDIATNLNAFDPSQ